MVPHPPDELIPTRESLLERLKDAADNESWRTFFETYWRLIYYTGIKAGLSEVEAQDLVQETVISVCRSMDGFKYARETGSFKSWLLKLTRWRIVDQLRKRQRYLAAPSASSERDVRTSTIERVPEPASLSLETTWDEEWNNNLMQAAIERVKKKVDPKHWQIFDLRVFKQWPVRRIAAALGISTAKVYVVVHRLKRLLRKQIHELETKGTI